MNLRDIPFHVRKILILNFGNILQQKSPNCMHFLEQSPLCSVKNKSVSEVSNVRTQIKEGDSNKICGVLVNSRNVVLFLQMLTNTIWHVAAFCILIYIFFLKERKSLIFHLISDIQICTMVDQQFHNVNQAFFCSIEQGSPTSILHKSANMHVRSLIRSYK